MEIEINSNLNNDEDSQENNGNAENNAENIDENNNLDHLNNSNKAFKENKISLTKKADIKFGLFCDLLEKCLKQKSKVKSQ